MEGEVPVEEAPKIETIGNLEDAKRFFSDGKYEEFKAAVEGKGFKFFIGDKYKYAHIKKGAMDFVATNLIGGFARQCEDVRKYFFICFRCVEVEKKVYEYPSFWIVNTTTDPKVVLELFGDFEFTELQAAEFCDKLINRSQEHVLREDFVK